MTAFVALCGSGGFVTDFLRSADKNLVGTLTAAK